MENKATKHVSVADIGRTRIQYIPFLQSGRLSANESGNINKQNAWATAFMVGRDLSTPQALNPNVMVEPETLNLHPKSQHLESLTPKAHNPYTNIEPQSL